MALPTLEEIEAMHKKAAEYRALEAVLDRLERAIRHETTITSIVAHDDANGHRDIEIDFQIEEGRAIFREAERVLRIRFDALAADLGV